MREPVAERAFARFAKQLARSHAAGSPDTESGPLPSNVSGRFDYHSAAGATQRASARIVADPARSGLAHRHCPIDNVPTRLELSRKQVRPAPEDLRRMRASDDVAAPLGAHLERGEILL
jgi:hypothetical protein